MASLIAGADMARGGLTMSNENPTMQQWEEAYELADLIKQMQPWQSWHLLSSILSASTA
jgi:hypothetical protein